MPSIMKKLLLITFIFPFSTLQTVPSYLYPSTIVGSTLDYGAPVLAIGALYAKSSFPSQASAFLGIVTYLGLIGITRSMTIQESHAHLLTTVLPSQDMPKDHIPFVKQRIPILYNESHIVNRNYAFQKLGYSLLVSGASAFFLQPKTVIKVGVASYIVQTVNQYFDNGWNLKRESMNKGHYANETERIVGEQVALAKAARSTS